MVPIGAPVSWGPLVRREPRVPFASERPRALRRQGAALPATLGSNVRDAGFDFAQPFPMYRPRLYELHRAAVEPSFPERLPAVEPRAVGFGYVPGNDFARDEAAARRSRQGGDFDRQQALLQSRFVVILVAVPL